MKKNKLLSLILVAVVLSMLTLPVGAAEATPADLTPGACPVHTDVTEWTEIPAGTWTGGALTTGHYKLTGNQATTSALTVAADQAVCIDLNGCNITAPKADGVRVFESYGGLTILDRVSTGVISGGKLNPDKGTADVDFCGGNILVSGSTAQLNLYGGTITGGDLDTQSYREHMFGGNIAVLEGAAFNLYGGTVSDGNIRFDQQATKYHGGGNIYAMDATVYIAGGTITGGVVDGSYTSGTAAVRRSYAAGGNLYVVNGTLTMVGGTISNGSSIAYLKANSSTSTNEHIANAYGGNIYLVNTTASITGGTITGGSVDGTATVASASASAAIGVQGGNLYCGENATITIGGDALFTSGVVKNNYTSARGGNIYIGSDSAVTLEGNAQILDGVCPDDNARGGNIFVVEKLTMNGGRIANGTAGWGSNMMLQSGAEVTMNGGTIAGGIGGTSVLVQRGTFTITAGVIENSVENAMALSVQGTSDSNGGKAYITGGRVGNVATNRISELYISNAEIGTISNGALATVAVGENVVSITNPTAFQTGEAAVEADGKFTTYAKLTDALATAANTKATVYMAKDVAVSGDVDLYSKLELNGKNLTATGVIDATNNDAAILDTTGKGSAVGADVKLRAGNGMLGIDAANNGVVKYEKVTVKQNLENTSEDAAYLKFVIDKAAADTLLDEAILAGSDVKIQITVTSAAIPGGSHTYVYDGAMVQEYVQDWDNKMFTCTITGISLMGECQITAQVVSEDVVVSARNVTNDPSEVYYNTKWDGKTLKVLCVGNSFARNATKVLYQIAEAHGVEEIVLGVLYIGGCSVETHWNNAKSGEAAYSYYKNTTGDWEVTKNTNLLYGLQDEQWDVITITQGQGLYGIAESYDGCLEELVDYINHNKTNPDSQIAFHMTWAFPKDSTIDRFGLYDYNQEWMFQCIAETAKNRILPTEGIDFLLPSGSAIQNARTALGDIFSDDDRFHLGKIGEYVAGYAWFAYLTGEKVEALKYIDPSVANMQSSHQAILDAVNAALDDPFTVTQIAK